MNEHGNMATRMPIPHASMRVIQKCDLGGKEHKHELA
jgi:hypothetical protein